MFTRIETVLKGASGISSVAEFEIDGVLISNEEDAVDAIIEHRYGLYGICRNQPITVRVYHINMDITEAHEKCYWAYNMPSPSLVFDI